MTKTLERIEREIGVPGLVALLADLSSTDLQSVMLEVYRQKARHRTPASVLADYETNRFVRPSPLSPVRLLEWERAAFASLPPEFQAIVLAPVAPLGTCSAIALVDQNRVMSTARNSEVVSDSTNVLALECASQRRQLLAREPKSASAVHLAASHRLLRAQRYEANPLLLPHFSAFAMCSSGRNQGNSKFELTAFTLHIGVYIRAIRAYLGADIPLRVAFTDFGSQGAALLADLSDTLQATYAGVECVRDDQRESGRDYYDDLCFHIYATVSGQLLELGDGGAVDWTGKLLNNAKERCVISGIGSERVCTTLWDEYHPLTT